MSTEVQPNHMKPVNQKFFDYQWTIEFVLIYFLPPIKYPIQHIFFSSITIAFYNLNTHQNHHANHTSVNIVFISINISTEVQPNHIESFNQQFFIYQWTIYLHFSLQQKISFSSITIAFFQHQKRPNTHQNPHTSANENTTDQTNL